VGFSGERVGIGKRAVAAGKQGRLALMASAGEQRWWAMAVSEQQHWANIDGWRWASAASEQQNWVDIDGCGRRAAVAGVDGERVAAATSGRRASRGVNGRKQHLQCGTSASSTSKMHRGERKHIFAFPLSSKAKCLPLLPSLLEDEFSMHSDLGKAFLLLHGVVGLSLTLTNRQWKPKGKSKTDKVYCYASIHGRRIALRL
jgi:hypothetical protein